MASTFWRCAHHTLKKVHQNAYAVLSSRLYLNPYLNSCLKASFTACYSSCSHSEGTVFKRARHFPERTAIADNSGKFTYNNILELSRHFGQQIIDKCTGVHDEDLQGKRVAFLCPKDVRYVAIQWAIWRYGGVAVPLSPSHPQNMLEYFITDSQSTLIVSTEQFRSRLTPLAEKLNMGYLEVPACQARSSDVGNMTHEQTAVEIKTKSWDDTGAMIFYTSGTTGKPKGVLTTHGNIRSQITDMVQAWGWTEDDRILHVLPLHHVHGVINVLSCPLWVGATCIMLEEFDSEKIWQYLTGSNLSLFMAVPTIYSKLIQFYQDKKYTKEEKENIKNKCLELRLMVSGSSALPEPTMKAWEDISGHTLLERYGMTEIGMALSNPLHGARIPVGATWGRRMVTGHLRSNGINVSERRVGRSLVHVAPDYHRERHDRTKQQTNPIPYSAEYFGHKLHIDQNEKLNMYGIVHVCAVDGLSGKIVSHTLMPVKNNLIIYENIYRSSVLTYGLWDQLRVDKGREFVLMLYIQDMLSRHRRNTNRLPYKQTTSCKNHRIERMWGEFNARVNYPIKRVLNELVEKDVLDMDDDITKHSVSWVGIRVCHAGCRIFIDSWNSHFVRGRGAPNDLQVKCDRTAPIQSHLLPDTCDAVMLYEESGGQLTYWPEFGKDPLSAIPHLNAIRNDRFCQQFDDFSEIFSCIVNGQPTLFQNAILYYRDLTYQYCQDRVAHL